MSNRMIADSIDLSFVFEPTETLNGRLYDNYSDYHTLPHYGLIPDWYLRYWELHNMIFDYLEGDSDETA